MARKVSKVSSKAASKAASKGSKADPAAVAIEAIKGMNAAQLAALLSAIKAEKDSPPTPVSPKKAAKTAAATDEIIVRPVAEVIATKPAVKLPVPISNPLATGWIENVPVICTGISPIIYNYKRPSQIVNLVHPNGTPFVVYMGPRTAKEIETGGKYLLSGLLEGTDETPTVCRQSKPYNGVTSNIVKKVLIEKP